MVPWELEAVLIELGWTLVDGWGDWSGVEPEDERRSILSNLPASSIRLQQATATTWGFVAE